MTTSHRNPSANIQYPVSSIRHPAKPAQFLMRLWRFPKGDISKEVPPDFAVAKYLGFLPAIASLLAQARRAGAPQNLWESAPDLLNLKYLATALQRNRCRLEETGMAESLLFKQG